MRHQLSRYPSDSVLARGFGCPTPESIDPDLSLAGGLPASEALPAEVLKEAFESTMQNVDRAFWLQYSDSRGVSRLRRILAQRLEREVGSLVVTNGALHGLSLTLQALVNPDDTGFVESPCYPYSARAIEISGAEMIPIPIADSETDLNYIERLLASGVRPKFFYCVPIIQNPSGRTQEISYRRALSSLARKYGFVVIADMAYAELGGTKMSQDTGFSPDVTVELWTFSKTLGPGLRTGVIAGPEAIVERVAAIRSSQDQHTGVLTQHVVATVLEDKAGYESIVCNSRAVHRSRLDVALEALASVHHQDVSISPPEGGLFVWLRVNADKCDVGELQARARSLGTDFVVGTSFDPLARGAYGDCLRIGVANGSQHGLQQGLRRLRQALADFDLAEAP